MALLHFAKALSSTFIFLFLTNTAFAFNDEIEVIRQRLIDDALEEKGFLPRTSRYIHSDFTKTEAYLNSLQTDGSWTDVDYADQDNDWHPLVALDRILVMTFAFRNASDPMYKNDRLLSGIKSSLQYWYAVNPTCKNWYKNQIAKQFYFSNIALLLQDFIPDELLGNMIADLTEKPTMTGSNRTLLSIAVLYRGVLEKNPGRIASGVKGVMQQVEVTTKEGIQPDYSFHQHGAFLYNGNYGSNFLRDTIWLASIVQGTQFSFTPEHLEILRSYYLKGTRWMLRSRVFDYNVRGREVGRPTGFELKAVEIVPQLNYFIKADPAHANQYVASKQHILKGEPQEISGNKHFWRSDYTAHHRPAYFTSLKMCSERTVGMEMDVNTENLLGYYLPFGLTYIYRRGDEYQGIFPVWDWARLPGVTSPHRAFSSSGRSSQETSFVGGVSDGTYGVSAMDLGVKETQAKKSWFWFDKEWVALGAGIQSTNENAVVTGINQTLLNGKVVVGGNTPGRGEKILKNPGWVWHDSVAYVFPKQQTVTLKADEQSGTLQRIYGLADDRVYRADVFSLWFEHGLQPKNATYEYIVVPGCGAADITAYAQDMPLTVLSNTPQIQAVTHHKLQITGIAFHEAGSFPLNDNFIIKVNRPCLVLISHAKNEVTVSDPTAGVKKLKITMPGKDGKPKTETLQLPDGEFAGKSVTISW